MFGSTASRLALSGSDIDVLVMNTGDTFIYDKCVKLLSESQLFESIDDIRTAEVPIITAEHKATGISIDFVFNREDGLKGLALVRTLMEEYPEMRHMYFVIKSLLKLKRLHKLYHGGIGSFVLVNMIVFYLQSQHKQYKGQQRYLQDHIIDFFELYSKQMDMKQVGLSIREGGFTFHKEHEYLCKEGNMAGEFKLCIESPLSPIDDIGGGIRKIGIIKRLFALANQAIKTNLLLSNSFVLLAVPDAHKLRDKFHD